MMKRFHGIVLFILAAGLLLLGTNARAAGAATSTAISASLTEYAIELSQQTVPPGNVSITVTNDGDLVHSLAVQGPGFTAKLPKALQPGQTATLLLANLRPGSYMVYCPIDNHANMGMKTTLTVDPPTTVNVALTEYRVALSQTQVPQGDVDFQVMNNGTMPHSLAVVGPGVSMSLRTALQPGETATLHVPNMMPGRYMVYCPLDGHAIRGMQTTIMVVGATATAEPPSCGCGSVSSAPSTSESSCPSVAPGPRTAGCGCPSNTPCPSSSSYMGNLSYTNNLGYTSNYSYPCNACRPSNTCRTCG